MNSKSNCTYTDSLELILIADDVVTMKEKYDDSILITRRWVKIDIHQLTKATSLQNWTEVNPREQNLKSKPAKQMKTTLKEDVRDIFHYLNRGISISAAQCTVKNIHNKKEVTILLKDVHNHGIFDGGHSFRVLIDALNNKHILKEKHVMLEIFTGVEDILYELARSRNTSTQVKEKSLANLEGKFDFIKEALKDECFYENISWVENQIGDISINYIIQILTAFNKKLENKSVLKTYSGAGSCETAYIREYDTNVEDIKNNLYYKMTPLYTDIFRFVDYVLKSIPNIYNQIGYINEKGKFGKLKGIGYNQKASFSLLFSEETEKTNYKIPNPLYFPILASMRQLYQENENGMYEWILDPFTVFDALSKKLVTKVMQYYFEKNGQVNEVGKSLGLWTDTYELVNTYLKDYKNKLEIKDLQKRIELLEKENRELGTYKK